MTDKKLRLVGNRELIWFFVTLFISKILFSNISGYVKSCGTAAYMQTALCSIVAIAVFIASVLLSGGDTDLFCAAEQTWGKVFAKAVGMAFAIIFIAYAGVMMRVYTDIISSVALADSSDFFIMLFLVVAVIFACYAGTGVLTAYSYGAGIVLVLSLGAILILNIPDYDYTNIYPVFGNGVKSILKGFDGSGVYADILAIFLITPYLRREASVKKSGISAIIISGVIITLTTLCYIMSVEYPFSGDFTLPVLEIAFDVNLDVVFQRAEGLFFFLWIFSGFIVIGAYLNFALLSFVRAFNLSDRRAPIWLFVLLAWTLALALQNSAVNSQAYNVFYNIFTLIAFLFPLVMFSARRIKKR